jgi:predicted membrane-bound spermidine synthase
MASIAWLFSTIGGNMGITNDPWVYRNIVGMLGLLVLSVVLGAVVLVKDISQGILALASASVGGLVGLLVPSLMTKNTPGAQKPEG